MTWGSDLHHVVCTWADAENHEATSGVWLPHNATWETAISAAEDYAEDVADTTALKLVRCDLTRVFHNTDPLLPKADPLCILERAGILIFALDTPVLPGRESLRGRVVIPGLDPTFIGQDGFGLNYNKLKLTEFKNFLISPHNGLSLGDAVAGGGFKATTADYWQWRDLLTYSPSWWKTKTPDWFF